MHIPDEIKDGVKQSFPILDEMDNEELKGKVIDAWALSLHKNGYTRIEEMPGSGNPGGPVKGTQTEHILGVAKMSLAMLDILEETYNDSLGIDRDLLLAAALCHDVGKPFEYNPDNQKRWNDDPRVSGKPALRHTLYGVHIALTVGLPEEVAHACGCHSHEGEFVERSLGNTIIHHADYSWWGILKIAHQWSTPWGELPGKD